MEVIWDIFVLILRSFIFILSEIITPSLVPIVFLFKYWPKYRDSKMILRDRHNRDFSERANELRREIKSASNGLLICVYAIVVITYFNFKSEGLNNFSSFIDAFFGIKSY